MVATNAAATHASATASRASPYRARVTSRVGGGAASSPARHLLITRRADFRDDIAAAKTTTTPAASASDDMTSADESWTVRAWTAEGGDAWTGALTATPSVRVVRGSDDDASERKGGEASSSSSSSSSSSFDARAYFARLNTKTEGRVLLTAKTLPSTQRLVSANAADADAVVPDGLICVADVQVSGVGRGGNQWSSPPGCLMFSFLTPHAEGRTLPFLQYVATMAAVEAIQDVADDAMTTARKAAAEDSSSPAPPLPPFRRGTGRTVDARIKWPNDLYSGGVKIGGVLCQSTYANGRFDVVIGVGLNLDNAEPTTCVNEIIAKRLARDGLVVAPGGECTRERLLAGFMNRFEALSGMLSATRSFSGLEASYLRQWLHTDQDVVIEDASGGGAAAAAAAGSARVTIKGVTATGYLLAVDEKGTRYELHPDGNSLDFFKGLVRKKLPS